MTTLTDPEKGSFRLSMLLYDTRYRSTTIQVIALLGFMLGAAWLVNNVIENLSAAGKTFDYGFLAQPSGYDINQKLIEYNSQSTHARAAVVGLLNTLLVATMGCITATVIGVLVGILRLSKNWIISRLAAVYVESLRNVPVLLWILLTMSVAIEYFPSPREFKGDNPVASMKLFDSIAVTNRGVYLPEPLFSRGLGDMPVFWNSFSISLDLIAILVVLFVSFWIRGRIKRRADAIQEATGERPNTWHFQLAVVVFPIAILLWALGFHFGYPVLKGFGFKGGIHMRNSLLALWLALSLYTAAFIAENVRAGIMAISKGQTEAAAALGLRGPRIMRLVILPQAMRVIVPPLISQYLNLTKNSSLAIAVGYMDITGTLGGITLNQTGREMETLLLLMLCYLIISLSISAVMNYYNERTKLQER
jgi:general L-amino acid transport system permease protein